MAKFEPALKYVLAHEGGWANHPADKGGPTNFGITLKTAQQYGIATETELKAITPSQVAFIYRNGYWRFDGTNDQRVATKIFDMAVNMGLPKAVKLLQALLNYVSVLPLKTDGCFGPRTLEAANRWPPDELLEGLKKVSLQHYQAIVERDPTQAVFLNNWTRRAQAVPSA